MKRKARNIVDEAAALIDPDAFSNGVWIDGYTGKPHEAAEARKAYMQSKAKHQAAMVLKLALQRLPGLKRELIEAELDGWEELNIPVRGDGATIAIIEAKYGDAQ